jgi:hypothetical protein
MWASIITLLLNFALPLFTIPAHICSQPLKVVPIAEKPAPVSTVTFLPGATVTIQFVNVKEELIEISFSKYKQVLDIDGDELPERSTKSSKLLIGVSGIIIPKLGSIQAHWQSGEVLGITVTIILFEIAVRGLAQTKLEVIETCTFAVPVSADVVKVELFPTQVPFTVQV